MLFFAESGLIDIRTWQWFCYVYVSKREWGATNSWFRRRISMHINGPIQHHHFAGKTMTAVTMMSDKYSGIQHGSSVCVSSFSSYMAIFRVEYTQTYIVRVYNEIHTKWSLCSCVHWQSCSLLFNTDFCILYVPVFASLWACECVSFRRLRERLAGECWLFGCVNEYVCILAASQTMKKKSERERGLASMCVCAGAIVYVHRSSLWYSAKRLAVTIGFGHSNVNIVPKWSFIRRCLQSFVHLILFLSYKRRHK